MSESHAPVDDGVTPQATATTAAPAAEPANAAEPPADFSQLALPEPLAKAVTELGYEAPTEVQARCIPALLAGRDLLGQAQTGTGKTAAFALPLLARIDTRQRAPQALVLAPTRELALQVAEACQRYARHLPDFQVVPIYGGQSYTLQIRQLKHGPQVVVGTPGRLLDHLRRGTLAIGQLRTLVLDEADEMLSMGFADEVDQVFDQVPADCQRALFSATLPPAIVNVARTRLTDPVEVRIEPGAQHVETIEQSHCVVTRHHKLDVLTRLLELEPFDGMVVFVRTRHATAELADRLKAHGFTAEPLSGDMGQEQRERTVERLRRGQLDIVVATDVAARGLDVERVTHVVNYDIPTDPQTYVHRIGRTGRAGRGGRAILLVEPRERGLLRAIERTFGAPVPRIEPPSAAELTHSRIERFTAQLRSTLAEQDLDFFYRLVADIAREQEIEPLDIAAALAHQLQQSRPLEAEELPKPTTRPVQRRAERPAPGGPRQRREYDDRRGDERPQRRPERHERHERQAGNRGGRDRDMPDMTGYRIEVGHDHGVTPREIVGAIANEAELEGRYIGRIDIHDDHSTVDLPSGMPREVFQHLQRVYVRGQALRISELDAAERGQRPQRRFEGPRRDDRPDRPGRSFQPRHRDGDERPRRPFKPRDRDDRPRQDRAAGDERPRRRFKADDGGRPRYQAGDGPRGAGAPAKRAFKPKGKPSWAKPDGRPARKPAKRRDDD